MTYNLIKSYWICNHRMYNCTPRFLNKYHSCSERKWNWSMRTHGRKTLMTPRLKPCIRQLLISYLQLNSLYLILRSPVWLHFTKKLLWRPWTMNYLDPSKYCCTAASVRLYTLYKIFPFVIIQSYCLTSGRQAQVYLQSYFQTI